MCLGTDMVLLSPAITRIILLFGVVKNFVWQTGWRAEEEKAKAEAAAKAAQEATPAVAGAKAEAEPASKLRKRTPKA